MIRNKYTQLFLFGMLLFGTLIGTASAAPFLQAQNQKAGESLSFSVSGIHQKEIVEIQLQRPQEVPLKFQIQADENGKIHHSIHSLHTQKNGIYTLSIKRTAGEPLQKQISVFPGSVSSYTSSLQLQKQTAEANGLDTIPFVVHIRDAFENNISNTSVRVISSRNTDRITLKNTKTDNQGRLYGSIQSQEAGISAITALADNQVIFEKPQAVFYISNPKKLNSGSSGNKSYGEFLQAQIFGNDQQTEASYFTIENIPAETLLNEVITFKVVARDINGEVVPQYKGVVRFNTPNDLRSVLPSEYRFTNQDQGEHTFYLAASFGTVGNQLFEVHDLDDFRIAGEATLNVKLGNKTVTPPSNPALQILTPTPGKHQTNKVTITGSAIDVESVRIVDGVYELVTNLEVDAQGNFVFQTPRLGDGIHIFQAFDMYSDLSSQKVEIEIDSSPPNSIQVQTEPALPFEPGQEFQIIVTSNEPLSSASAVYQDVLTQLIPSGTEYVRTLTAPFVPGKYPVHIFAADMLGNEVKKDDALVINITKPEPKPVEPSVEEPLTPSEPMGTIENLHSQSGDGKITLFWSPPKSGEATQYKIEFAEQNLFLENTEEGDIGVIDDLFNTLDPIGEDDPFAPLLDGNNGTNGTSTGAQNPTGGSQNLLVFNQSNITPDNRVQWYVDNLQDNKQYFFQVRAIDKDGNEGPASTPVEGLTNGARQLLIPEKAPTTGSNGTVIALIVLLFGAFIGIKRYQTNKTQSL